jgi:NhaA family Na+:H+ antiporter
LDSTPGAEPTSPAARPAGPRRRLFTRLSETELHDVVDILRTETVGGVLLLIGATVAIAWANSPWSAGYEHFLEVKIGPHALHLDLTVEQWAGDGLLAIFFFVAGLEVKRELVVGALSQVRQALVPVVAAASGVAVPALVYMAITRGAPGTVDGWAVPVATDIAFALAVLAILGSHLPTAMRTFLLTLAVVDDLIAITIIAVFYTEDLQLMWLALAALPLAAFAWIAKRRTTAWYVLIPLAFATWALVHSSGIHATVAGVALGCAVPVRQLDAPDGTPRGVSPSEHLEHAVRPISASVAVPLFALTAAGVSLSLSALRDAVQDTVFAGVGLGLVLGKTFGIFMATLLTARYTRAQIDESLRWLDVFGVSLLAGIGFTVSLLIGELAFPDGGERAQAVKLAVLVASLTSAVLAALVLVPRNAMYKRIEELERTAPISRVGDATT